MKLRYIVLFFSYLAILLFISILVKTDFNRFNYTAYGIPWDKFWDLFPSIAILSGIFLITIYHFFKNYFP